MAKTRRTITLDEKIEKAQDAVFRAKDKYDSAVAELNKLLQKKKELDNQELIKAFEGSSKTLDEVIAFMNGKADPEEE